MNLLAVRLTASELHETCYTGESCGDYKTRERALVSRHNCFYHQILSIKLMRTNFLELNPYLPTNLSITRFIIAI